MSLPGKWVATDPGESLGWSVYHEHLLVDAGTSSLWDFIHAFAHAMGVTGAGQRSVADVSLVQMLMGCEKLVYENWRIYPWKAQELSWDECRTARGIGALEFICQQAGIPYESQGADTKDTAEAAGAADLFLRPLDENRHANDSIRHGVVQALTQGKAVAWSG